MNQVCEKPVGFLADDHQHGDYIRAGWALVPIPPQTKGPILSGWNKRENCITNPEQVPIGHGVGLAHAYSSTCSIDIDDLGESTRILAEQGIDLQALLDAPDAVQIHSGNPGHAKLIYALPFALPSKKISFRASDGQNKVAYEFRCASASGTTVQDVLPPSIHPVTLKPYQWAGRGNWQHLPPLPDALLAIWQGIIDQDAERTIRNTDDLPASWEEITSALYSIPASCGNDDWVTVGMALHQAGTASGQLDQAQALYDEWSSTGGDKYKGPRDVATRWRSFKADPEGIKLGSLFHLAKQHGWVRPVPDVSGMFAPIERPARRQSVPHVRADTDVGQLFDELALTQEDVMKMQDAEFLIPNMIVRGHVAAYVSPGNGGKTTIFIHLCETLAADGLTVLYVNVDGSPGDLRRHHAHASRHGYKVIAPDAKNGKSGQDVITILTSIAKGEARCDDVVLIIDTLKKFVDVINKREAKAFYSLLRSISVKGATICLLGHTNKYKDDEGKWVYEGTADLRNDLDELIYLDSYKDEQAKTLTITTRPDKVRAEFAPATFVIDLTERSVTESASAVNIHSKEERKILDLAKEAITAGKTLQKEIIEFVRQRTTHGDKKIRETLIRLTRSNNPEIKAEQTGRGKDLHYSIVDPFADLPDFLNPLFAPVRGYSP